MSTKFEPREMLEMLARNINYPLSEEERFSLDDVPATADVSLVVARFFHWWLESIIVDQSVNSFTHNTITRVIDLYARRIEGDEPTKEAWVLASSALSYAAADALYACAMAMEIASYAYDTSEDPEEQIRSSLELMASEVIANTAKDQRDKLLELLKGAETTGAK